MALSTNLVRRGGIYYFRCRVPTDLVARLGRAELSRSLATSYPDVARRRGRRAAHLVEQVWLLVRECMSPEQIDDVIRRWLKAELDKDEVARTNTAFAGDYANRHRMEVQIAANQMIGSDAIAKIEEWQRYVAETKWEEAQPWANIIIREQALPIEKGSDDYRLLCRRLLPALADFHGIRLERSEGNWSHQIALSAAPLDASESEVGPKTSGQPLKVAIDEYLASPQLSRNRDRKRILKVEGSLSLFSEWVGELQPIKAIDRAGMGRFLQTLEALPPNWTKRFRGKTLAEVLELARDNGLQGMAPNTINSHLGIVTGFFDWCISRGKLEVGKNPAAGVRVKDAAETLPENRRATFTTEELEKLFTSPLFTGCKSEARPKLVGEFIIRDWRFWLFPILLYTGARLGEVCQLLPTDVVKEDGVWCFNIDESGGKRVKTAAGIRKVPIHQALIRMGILDLADKQRGTDRLLHDVPPTVEGYNHYASRWGLDYLKHVLGDRNAEGEKYVLHGFRHTMETMLRGIEGVEEWVQHAIIGHEYKHVSERYGKKPVSRLNSALQLVDFGIDLSHLYVTKAESTRMP